MRRTELRGLATPQPTVTTRTAVYILLSGHCLERRAAGGEGRCKKLWWSGGSQGGWRGQKIKQRALGVGGEGWMMPFHAKKALPSSAGWPRSSLNVEKAAAAATEHSGGDSPALACKGDTLRLSD